MIDWTKPVCTKHETPKIGYPQADCSSGIKRVAISSASSPTWGPTIYRFDEQGRSRQGAGPSDYDLVNYHSEDGKVRLTPSGEKVVCAKQAA